MLRRLIVPIVLALSGLAGGAGAQEPAPAAAPPQAAPPAESVQVAPLAAPDAFTTSGRDTGLPATLWRGASAKTARTVLTLLATKPLSPAGAQLARRILATGAPGPEGAQADPGLAALRANALAMQGDAKAAAAILVHAPGVDRSPELARAVAETALLSGDAPRACQAAAQLTEGRDEVYWLRLRTYCQAIAGQTAQAQLTFDLAQSQARDPVFGRLMGAKLAGAGDPGAPSARNGLDVALSRTLGLDPAAAKPSPAVAAALAPSDPTEPSFDALTASREFGDMAAQIRAGLHVTYGAFMAAMNSSKLSGGYQLAVLLVDSLDGDTSPKSLEILEEMTLPEGKAPLGRNLALEAAARSNRLGEVALLALWTCAEAGSSGLAPGDRVRIVSALHAVGLERDARNFVLEGLAALK